MGQMGSWRYANQRVLLANQDQFDTIDLSDNEVKVVDGFPLLKRLRTLLLNNNQVAYVLTPGALLPATKYRHLT